MVIMANTSIYGNNGKYVREYSSRPHVLFSRDSYRSFLNGVRDMQKTQSNETFKDLIEPDRRRRRKGDVFGKISCVPCRKPHNSEVAMEMLIHDLNSLIDMLNRRAKSKIIKKQNLGKCIT